MNEKLIEVAEARKFPMELFRKNSFDSDPTRVAYAPNLEHFTKLDSDVTVAVYKLVRIMRCKVERHVSTEVYAEETP